MNLSMLCERVTALLAGTLTGMWYANTFPEEENGKDKKNNKGKK